MRVALKKLRYFKLPIKHINFNNLRFNKIFFYYQKIKKHVISQKIDSYRKAS